MAAASLVTNQPQIVRPHPNFLPSLWGDRFDSFSLDQQVWDTYTKEIEVLKEEVRSMLVTAGKSTEKMNLINIIERLGLSYHFEKEIEVQLEHLFYFNHANDEDNEEYDLCTIALHFRIFRQHGYDISCDVFNKFREKNGQFKEAITNDLMGIQSLYEATQLRTHGEDILDEALVFTTTHLQSNIATNLNPSVAKQVVHALKQPLHKGVPRLEARHYISIYEEDDSKNDLLLRLAKLDFNLVQLLHRQELCQISRWWKDLDFASKLSYARNRLVECYFWAVAVYYEPFYSDARIMLTKITTLLSITDDTYDAYGTLEELKLYTNAIERWEIRAIDQLPDYMKILYEALLELYKEFDEQLSKQEKTYGLYYSKEAFKELVKSYEIETKWYTEGYVAPFDEYMSNGLITATYFLLATSSLLGMGEFATIEAFEWTRKKPKVLIASSTIGRLINDIMSDEREQDGGHVATGIDCYRKEHGVSKEEAIDELYKRIENAWKDINQGCSRPNAVSVAVFMRVLNLTRILDVIYKYEDGYTNPERVLKGHVLSLFVDPIPIEA